MKRAVGLSLMAGGRCAYARPKVFSPEYLRRIVSAHSCDPFYQLNNSVYVRDVQEPILIFVLLVDRAHQRSSRRQDLIDENEDGFLGTELDALADDVDELAHCKVGGDEVLLLVDGCNVRLLHLLADHLLSEQSAAGDADSIERGTESRNRSSRSAMGEVVALTGMRSAYFCRMRSASALRFSNGCSSLYLERILALCIG